jgi:hypothetical protein
MQRRKTMCSEATKESSDKSGRGGFSCCPGDFRGMFGDTSDCCADKSDLPDCAEIMSRMKAGCCGPEGGREKK